MGSVGLAAVLGTALAVFATGTSAPGFRVGSGDGFVADSAMRAPVTDPCFVRFTLNSTGQ